MSYKNSLETAMKKVNDLYTLKKEYNMYLEQIRMNPEYTDEGKQKQVEALNLVYNPKINNQYAEIGYTLNQLEEMRTSNVSLNDTGFLNDLTLIGTLGSSMDAITLTEMLNKYRGNEKLLGVLENKCTDSGVPYARQIFSKYRLDDTRAVDFNWVTGDERKGADYYFNGLKESIDNPQLFSSYARDIANAYVGSAETVAEGLHETIQTQAIDRGNGQYFF